MQSIKNLGSVAKAGTIISSISTTVPDGYFPMLGQLVSSVEYPDLYAVIGNSLGTYVSGGTTYFYLPSFINCFPRQKGGLSAGLGVFQDDASIKLTGSPGHQDDQTYIGVEGAFYKMYAYGYDARSGYGSGRGWILGFDLSKTDLVIADENRPANMSVFYFIKY